MSKEHNYRRDLEVQRSFPGSTRSCFLKIAEGNLPEGSFLVDRRRRTEGFLLFTIEREGRLIGGGHDFLGKEVSSCIHCILPSLLQLFFCLSYNWHFPT